MTSQLSQMTLDQNILQVPDTKDIEHYIITRALLFPIEKISYIRTLSTWFEMHSPYRVRATKQPQRSYTYSNRPLKLDFYSLNIFAAKSTFFRLECVTNFPRSCNSGNWSSPENCICSASLDIDTHHAPMQETCRKMVKWRYMYQYHLHVYSPACHWRDNCFTLRMLRLCEHCKHPKGVSQKLCWILCVKRAGAGLLGSRGEGERQCGAANS